MAMAKGFQVKMSVPDGATPGTVLNVPVKGGTEKIKIRVPAGCGPGTTLVLLQKEGSEEWSLNVDEVVPFAEELGAEQDGPQDNQQQQHLEQLRLEQQEQQYQQLQQQVQLQREMEQKRELQRIHQQEIKQQQMQQQELQQREEQRLKQQQDLELEWQEQQHQQYLQFADLQPPPSEQPAAYTVRLDTTVGEIDIIVRPDWSPNGTRRFLELVAAGDLHDLAFYRAIKGCIAQFGLPARHQWPPIPDDPPTGVPFLLGAVSFAAVGPDTRKSTLFICLGDMSHCLGEKSWETPIGAVAEASLDILDNIDTSHGDIAEFGGEGPETSLINSQGNAYLHKQFPSLTYIHSANLVETYEGGSEELERAHPEAASAEPPLNAASRGVQEAQQLAHQAQAHSLEAACRAQESASAGNYEQAQQAVRMAREAANAAEAAAKAAEAAAEGFIMPSPKQEQRPLPSQQAPGQVVSMQPTALQGSVRSHAPQLVPSQAQPVSAWPAQALPTAMPCPVSQPHQLRPHQQLVTSLQMQQQLMQPIPQPQPQQPPQLPSQLRPPLFLPQAGCPQGPRPQVPQVHPAMAPMQGRPWHGQPQLQLQAAGGYGGPCPPGSFAAPPAGQLRSAHSMAAMDLT